MIGGWLGVAAAQTVSGRSETVAQLRHDLFGAPIVPLYEFLHVASEGEVAVDAYVGFDAVPGRDAGLSVWALNAAGDFDGTRWRIGTQQGQTLLRPATFDGLWVSAPIGRFTEWVTWGGWARHDDLDDLLTGLPVARTELRHATDDFALVVGAQVEGADDLVGRQDASVHLGEEHGGVSLLGAIAEQSGGAIGVERTRGELSTRVVSGVTASTWAERRKTEVETLLADSILPVFAPDGVDEVGARVRIVGPRLASGSVSYGLGRYVGVDVPELTHRVDVAYAAGPTQPAVPGLGWRWRQGPGGAYHALSAVEIVPLADRTSLRATGALVPYHKGTDVWRLAAATGAQLAQGVTDVALVQLGADVSSDAVWALDVRAHAALTLEWP